MSYARNFLRGSYVMVLLRYALRFFTSNAKPSVTAANTANMSEPSNACTEAEHTIDGFQRHQAQDQHSAAMTGAEMTVYVLNVASVFVQRIIKLFQTNQPCMWLSYKHFSYISGTVANNDIKKKEKR